MRLILDAYSFLFFERDRFKKEGRTLNAREQI